MSQIYPRHAKESAHDAMSSVLDEYAGRFSSHAMLFDAYFQFSFDIDRCFDKKKAYRFYSLLYEGREVMDAYVTRRHEIGFITSWLGAEDQKCNSLGEVEERRTSFSFSCFIVDISQPRNKISSALRQDVRGMIEAACEFLKTLSRTRRFWHSSIATERF